MTILESETGLASDSASDNEGYDDVNLMDHMIMDFPQSGTTGGNKGDDSLMVQYRYGKCGSVAETVAYDLVLEVAMKAQHFQHRNLLIHGLPTYRNRV